METFFWVHMSPKPLLKIARMHHDVVRLIVKQASPCVYEDSAAKLGLNALARMEGDVPKLMGKQAAHCIDED